MPKISSSFRPSLGLLASPAHILSSSTFSLVTHGLLIGLSDHAEWFFPPPGNVYTNLQNNVGGEEREESSMSTFSHWLYESNVLGFIHTCRFINLDFFLCVGVYMQCLDLVTVWKATQVFVNELDTVFKFLKMLKLCISGMRLLKNVCMYFLFISAGKKLNTCPPANGASSLRVPVLQRKLRLTLKMWCSFHLTAKGGDCPIGWWMIVFNSYSTTVTLIRLLLFD